jgi:hypothetical protein
MMIDPDGRPRRLALVAIANLRKRARRDVPFTSLLPNLAYIGCRKSEILVALRPDFHGSLCANGREANRSTGNVHRPLPGPNVARTASMARTRYQWDRRETIKAGTKWIYDLGITRASTASRPDPPVPRNVTNR